MQLLIVIVNYRSAALTADALRSLIPELAHVSSSHVVVVDNASGDDSVEVLRKLVAESEALSRKVSLVAAEKNGGFSYGNNVGIRHWLKTNEPPEYVLLLNPDTIVRPGAMTELLSFMEAHRDVGIAGSRLEDPDGTAQCSAFRFPSIPSEFESTLNFGPIARMLARWAVAPQISSDPHPTDWVAGASMIIRWSVIDRVGMLDEAYFMYFEEVDFCLKAKRAGWSCWYVPKSRVVHLVGQVSQVTDPKRNRKRRPSYWFESRRRYFVKNYGRASAIAADLAWLSGHALHRLRLTVERKPADFPTDFIADFMRFGVIGRGFKL